MNYKMIFEIENIDWDALANVYRIAPLGERQRESLETVFKNSMFKCFVYDNDILIGAGRALADGADCSYICDVAVRPEYQGRKIGQNIVNYLVSASKDHKKIILYASPGKEGFYKKLGFARMNTAMALFRNRQRAVDAGLIEAD